MSMSFFDDTEQSIYNVAAIVGTDVKDVFSKKRYCFDKLMNFVQNPKHGMICALYGLRRTGKTVLLEQCICALPTELREQSILVTCAKGCTFQDLFNTINSFKDKGFTKFFIDEITFVEDFIVGGNILADHFARIGITIVISGTDSFVIRESYNNTLYDRLELIHTTYISFKEYYSLTGENLESFIQSGGTLMNTEFSDYEGAIRYTNTAIADNIINALRFKKSSFVHEVTLTEIYEADDVRTAIVKLVGRFSYRIVLGSITKDYKNAPLNASLNNLTVRSNKLIQFKKFLNWDTVQEKIESALSITSNPSFTQHDLLEIVKYLKQLDVLMTIPVLESKEKYATELAEIQLISQPGLLFCHATEVIKILRTEECWLPECTNDDRNTGCTGVLTFALGEILERIVLLDTYCYYQNTRYYVSQYKDDVVEYDMIVYDRQNNKTYLFEIKPSSVINSGQQKHLVNQEGLQRVEHKFGPIVSRIVLYNGQSNTQESGIDYLNAEEFLLSIGTSSCIIK